MRALTLGLAALVAGVAAAPVTGAEKTVLRADRLLDVEAERMLNGHAVLISDGRIEAVGPADDLPNAEGAEIVDLGDATLLPGLLDSHVHLAGSHEWHGYRRLAVSHPRAAIEGVANAKRTLLAGFTTVRNLGAANYNVVALRDAVDDGTVPGPRILASGPSLGITGGHCDSNLLPYRYNVRAEGVANGPWAVREKVRQNVKYGADVIKFCGTGGVLSKGTRIGAQQFTFEEMEALVDEAHLLGLKVAVHAHGTDGIKTALRAGVDSVEHASLIDDEGIRLAKRNGAFLSMDIYVSDFILAEGEAAGILEESLQKERIVGRAQRESFQRALRAGVKMAYGTDAGVYPHGTNARQLAYMVEWGMTPMQAVQTATTSTAELFGREAEVGSITPGKYADIIAVDGNPLDNIRELEDIDFVMKDGVIYKNELLD